MCGCHFPETRCTYLPALQVTSELDILGGCPVVNSGSDCLEYGIEH
jgi:hypothetical protein